MAKQYTKGGLKIKKADIVEKPVKYYRFKDLSSESVRENLTESQRKYLAKTTTHMDYRYEDMTMEWYRSLPAPFRRNVRYHQSEILSGAKYAQLQSNIKENYKSGFRYGGRADLEQKFDKVYNSLTEDDRDMFMQEMPDLWTFYKDKTGHHKRNEMVTDLGMEYQLELAEEKLDEWADEYGIDLDED